MLCMLAVDYREEEVSVKRATAGGFTFVEVVVAMGLLALVLAGCFGLMMATMRVRQASHDYYAAIMIANNRLERAKTVTFDNIPLLAESEVNVDEVGTPTVEGTFMRSTEIETGWAGDARLTRVTVTVSPPMRGRSGTRTEASVSTLITEYLEP